MGVCGPDDGILGGIDGFGVGNADMSLLSDDSDVLSSEGLGKTDGEANDLSDIPGVVSVGPVGSGAGATATCWVTGSAGGADTTGIATGLGADTADAGTDATGAGAGVAGAGLSAVGSGCIRFFTLAVLYHAPWSV